MTVRVPNPSQALEAPGLPPKQTRRSSREGWVFFIFALVGIVVLERTWVLVSFSDFDKIHVLESETPNISSRGLEGFVQYSVDRRGNVPPPIDQLTTSSSYPQTCESDFLLREDTTIASPTITENPARKIPKMIHQTSKSRCLHPKIYETSKEWNFPGWSFYFHDDEAVMRLLKSDFPEFPHLKQVAENCALSGTVKADLWRYVVLWQYGGIYADIDSAPHIMNETTILNTDDSFFVVEQYHLLSQYFMAASPRHPLMYYAIQNALLNLMQLPDTGRLDAALVTGPHALHAGYRAFRNDAGVYVLPIRPGNKPVFKGVFQGTNNRSVTVVGVGENQNEYVWRDKVSRIKFKLYETMGMEHFQKAKSKERETGTTCLKAILDTINS